jgi:simple sugar transport system ATP-binding protein
VSALSVEMRGVQKRYPRVVANQDASLSVREGEVHAVVGENGAGKSTLMKILYGLVAADQGEIVVRGRQLVRHSPAEAIRAGVGMVFQHFMLVPTLTVAENVVLGREPRRGVVLDRRRAIRDVEEVATRFSLPIDPRARLMDCSVGLQQRVEILKVLYRGSEVIILDEPTAVLTPQEVDELIRVMRGLASAGKSILLITHKLREVMAAADRVTIMRQGRTIETLETAKTSAAEIAEKMVGRQLAEQVRAAPRSGAIKLQLRGVSAMSDRGARGLDGVSIAVKGGEILGVCGIEGNGQTELLECIAGLRPLIGGEIEIDGRSVTRATPRERIESGLAHIPEDRHKRAVVLEFTVEENTILGAQRAFSRPLRMLGKAVASFADRIIQDGDVRPPDRSLVLRALSGGNQQKVVIGRELARKPKVLLAAHPTRGLDIGAIELIQARLRAARDEDAAIVLVSAELSELLALSDRMIVMFGGRVLGEVSPGEVDERKLGLMMAGQA